MRVTGPCENPHAQRAVRRERDSSFRHDRLGLSTCRAECTSSSASCNVWHVEDVRELSAIERRDEGCGARRALNAREWSGDATSGDATTSGDAKRGESEAQVRDFCSTRSAQLLPSTKCSTKAGVVLQAYRLTSFWDTRRLRAAARHLLRRWGEELRCSRSSFTRMGERSYGAPVGRSPELHRPPTRLSTSVATSFFGNVGYTS